jgi:hypothetical protein
MEGINGTNRKNIVIAKKMVGDMMENLILKTPVTVDELVCVQIELLSETLGAIRLSDDQDKVDEFMRHFKDCLDTIFNEIVKEDKIHREIDPYEIL